MNRLWIFGIVVSWVIVSANAGAQMPGGPVLGDYTLLPGDTLEITVWQEPDLQREVLIRPDGRFSFPLAGDVLAVGKTVPEVQQTLLHMLQRYIPEAVVTVTVISVDGNKIYVIGQVKNPGAFIVNPRVDVVQALAMAGGMTAFAAVNDVIILRRKNGRESALRFRYGQIEKGRNLEQNFLLEPGDVIIVP